jgi:hypothetical protein
VLVILIVTPLLLRKVRGGVERRRWGLFAFSEENFMRVDLGL